MADMVQPSFKPIRPVREACAHCVGFAVLLLLGAAAWVGVFMVCSRF